MKSILKNKGRQAVLAVDGLVQAHLDVRLFDHAGFPEATDSLAYDGVQRLLAVATTDGMVKIVGKAGVEALLTGTDRSPTKILQFLPGKGALVRVTKAGDVQLWGLNSKAQVDSLPCGDPVTSIAYIHNTAFLCMGCEGGGLQFAQLIAENGAPADGVCAAQGLELLPYELTAEELGGEGMLQCLSAINLGEQQRLLMLHSISGASVWDVRHQCCIVKTSLSSSPSSAFASRAPEAAQNVLSSAGPAISACWVGSQGLSFATGHEMGTILVWLIPIGRAGEPPVSPVGAELIMQARIAPEGDLGMPVRQLMYVAGDSLGGNSSLLAFGGQVLDQPDTLALLPLDNAQEGELSSTEAKSLPWYGMVQGIALVPPKGATESDAEPAAILVLMEGGQLILFDLPDLQPIPLSLPLQELPDLTVSAFAAPPPDPAAVDMHSVTLEQIRAAEAAAAASALVSNRTSDRWRWVFDGGRPPAAPRHIADMGNIYLSGHKDGRVRVWDMTVAVPALKATVPFDSGGSGPKLKPIAGLEVCAASGVLAVAHEKGEVRVYQFSPSAQEAVCVELHKPGRTPVLEEGSGKRQPPGFQRVVRVTAHRASVHALSIASSEGLVACGDDTGTVSVVDLAQPEVLFIHKVTEMPIVALAFGIHAEATSRSSLASDRSKSGNEPAQRSRCLLYVVSAEGAITVLDAKTGKSLGPRVSPKTSDRALSLAILDADGCLLPQYAAPLKLPWAENGIPEHLTAIDTGRRHRGSQMTSPTSSREADDDEGPFHRQGSRGSSDGAHLQTATTAEEDSYLAAAAEAAENARDGQRKHRFRTFLKDQGSLIKRLDPRGLDPREHDSYREARQKDSPKDPPGASLARRWSSKEGGQDDTQSDGSKSDYRDAVSQDAFSPSSIRSRGSNLSEFSDPPTSEAAEPSAGPTHVLVATTSYLRLYPVDGVLGGDRTTARKVTFSEPVSLAASFVCAGGPGLLCLTASGVLQIYTLPGLEQLLSQPLEACLGFPWSWTNDAALANELQRICAVSEGGDLSLIGTGWEAVRLGIAKGGGNPAQLSSLYDWDVARAAQAAASAERNADARERAPEDSNEAFERAAAEGQSTLPSPGRGNTGGDSRRGFGGFLNNVRDAAVKVAESTGQELSKLEKGIGTNLNLLGRVPSRIASRRGPPPSLDSLLSTEGKDPGGDTVTSRSGMNGAGPARMSRTQSGGRTGSPASRAHRSESGTPKYGSERDELFAGRPNASRGRPGVRTADEIRTAYGRSVSRQSDSVHAIASENRMKLEERGERLRNLDDRTEEMANNAKDFASMARQIRDREAAKKWWQL